MKKNDVENKLQDIIEKTGEGIPLDGGDVEFVLGLCDSTDSVALELLFEAARTRRKKIFGCAVFLYGFLYVSTYCRNLCRFCNYRSGNKSSPRYRKTLEEVIRAARQLEESGVHLIDVTMGEDPMYFEHGDEGFDALVDLVQAVKEEVDIPMMVSPGVVPLDLLPRLKEAGVSWFACYQETHNRRLFERLRPGQDYNARLDIKSYAQDHDMMVEEGILLGVGESAGDIAKSFEAMWLLDADQVRAMNFVPQPGTPMAGAPRPAPSRELAVIAMLRLMFPNRLIPATLDIDGLEGLKRRLEAGANVVTSIVPPNLGLAGVARSSMDIDEARRTVPQVEEVLKSLGLRPAKFSEYAGWVDQCR